MSSEKELVHWFITSLTICYLTMTKNATVYASYAGRDFYAMQIILHFILLLVKIKIWIIILLIGFVVKIAIHLLQSVLQLLLYSRIFSLITWSLKFCTLFSAALAFSSLAKQRCKTIEIIVYLESWYIHMYICTLYRDYTYF